MRALAFVVALGLAACGQSAPPGGEAAAQGGGGQGPFVDQCVAALVADNPQARSWAPDECAQRWERVIAAGPMAEAILAAAGGAMPRAGGFDGDVEVRTGAGTVSFNWQREGEMIPYDVVAALRERGAALNLVGCAQLGVGEFQRVFSATPAGGAAFQLGVFERTAPTANAFSIYGVEANFAGRVQTLAQLRSDGSEWVANECTY